MTSLSGESHLPSLLKFLEPVLDPDVYTFVTVSEAGLTAMDRPLGVFREGGSVSVICRHGEARARGLNGEGEFRMITLSVHSSLAAVGLTACVSTALADHGIACNVVAACHHDHLFVPAGRAGEALEVLRALS